MGTVERVVAAASEAVRAWKANRQISTPISQNEHRYAMTQLEEALKTLEEGKEAEP